MRALRAVAGTLVGTLLLVDLPVATLRYVLGATVMFAALYRWNEESWGIARAAAARGWCRCGTGGGSGASGVPLLSNGSRGGGAGLSGGGAVGVSVVAHELGTAAAAPAPDSGAAAGATTPRAEPVTNIPIDSWGFRLGAVGTGAISGLLGGMMGVSGAPPAQTRARARARRAAWLVDAGRWTRCTCHM